MPAVNYLWNPLNDNIVREFDDAGAVIAEYTTEANLVGNVVSQRRNGQDSVYHYDGQGSTFALTDATGNVTETCAYSAFGEVTAHTGSTVNPFQYIGQKGYYRDAETGEYEIRRRSLPALRGRWLSGDPRAALGENHFWYASNNPLVYTDPSGEAIWIPICCATCVASLIVVVGVPAGICWSASLRYKDDPMGVVVNGQRVHGMDAVWAAWYDCIQIYVSTQSRLHHVVGAILTIGSCVCCGAGILLKLLPKAAPKCTCPIPSFVIKPPGNACPILCILSEQTLVPPCVCVYACADGRSIPIPGIWG